MGRNNVDEWKWKKIHCVKEKKNKFKMMVDIKLQILMMKNFWCRSNDEKHSRKS
jgi:hypothetical protein